MQVCVDRMWHHVAMGVASEPPFARDSEILSYNISFSLIFLWLSCVCHFIYSVTYWSVLINFSTNLAPALPASIGDPILTSFNTAWLATPPMLLYNLRLLLYCTGE